jgi:isopentenyldiphosphate isomerase
MKKENLKIFNENREYIGVASREEVHQKGYWHETFHCWILTSHMGEDYLYFQLRSPDKADYPNLLDITAAGHLLAEEQVEDGIREVEEEIGIEVAIDDLTYIGIIPYVKELEGFIDKELAHVFLLERTIPFELFQLQLEEVSGMYKVSLNEFQRLWFEDVKEIEIEGFVIGTNGEKSASQIKVNKHKFVPHADQFYRETLTAIEENRGRG